MALSPPSLANFRARYAAFAGVADATVTYWLSDATREVDESWPIVSDCDPAMIAVAAHRMVKAGVAGIAGRDITALASSGFTDFKSGTFEV